MYGDKVVVIRETKAQHLIPIGLVCKNVWQKIVSFVVITHWLKSSGSIWNSLEWIKLWSQQAFGVSLKWNRTGRHRSNIKVKTGNKLLYFYSSICTIKGSTGTTSSRMYTMGVITMCRMLHIQRTGYTTHRMLYTPYTMNTYDTKVTLVICLDMV